LSHANFGVDGGVGSGKGIIAKDIRIAVFLDIVFVILLANEINSGENVDDTHIVSTHKCSLKPFHEEEEVGDSDDLVVEDPLQRLL